MNLVLGLIFQRCWNAHESVSDVAGRMPLSWCVSAGESAERWGKEEGEGRLKLAEAAARTCLLVGSVFFLRTELAE